MDSKNIFKCSKCNEVYQHKSGLSRHKVSCLRSVKFDCEKCNKSFTRKDSLKDHVKICCGKKDLACSLCPSVFLYSSKLKRHIKQAHSNKCTFCCLKCGRKYQREKFFKTHQIKCDGSNNSRSTSSRIVSHETYGFEPLNYFETQFADDEALPTMAEIYTTMSYSDDTASSSFSIDVSDGFIFYYFHFLLILLILLILHFSIIILSFLC